VLVSKALARSTDARAIMTIAIQTVPGPTHPSALGFKGAASERAGNKLKGFQDFYLQAKVSI